VAHRPQADQAAARRHLVARQRSGRGLGQWQPQNNIGASAQFAGDVDLAFVLADHLLRQSQTQPDTKALGAV